MENRILELFSSKNTVKRIQNKLPKLFRMAELDSQRAGKVGMEVGSLRERILISLLIYKFGEENVNAEIPITQTETDVIVFDVPISIKTITGKYFSGVKANWTVDAKVAKDFRDNYMPTCSILFARIIWDDIGYLHYIPLDVQLEALKRIGRKHYIKLPKAGTNPRGIEFMPDALSECVNHVNTKSIKINWKKENIDYNPLKRWTELWAE